jgi:hypothetical protein
MTGRKPSKKNEDYFGQKSLQSVYWAGFIAARGTIFNTKPTINITVKESKTERLRKFFEHVELNNNKKITTLHTKNRYIRKAVNVISSQWKEDLEVIYNLPSHRTKVYVPNLTKDLEVQAYLLGYLDTGAFIGYGNSELRIQINGNINFLNWIKCYVDKWCDSFKLEAFPFPIATSKTFTYVINCQRAATLYNLLSSLPIDKSDTWG